MIISDYTMVTHYKCNIWSVVIKRTVINYHPFNHLIISFRIFPEGGVVSFLFNMMSFRTFKIKIFHLDLLYRNFLTLGGDGDVIQPFRCYQYNFIKMLRIEYPFYCFPLLCEYCVLLQVHY